MRKVEVGRVKDGDSFAGKNGERFRMTNYDAPEKGKPYSNIATDYLERKIGGQTVGVETHGKDKFGRTLVTVYAPGQKSSVNDSAQRNLDRKRNG